MIFDLSPQENRNKFNAALVGAWDAPDMEPSLFQGAGTGLAMGIMRGGARVAQTIGVLGGGIIAHDFGTAAGDKAFSAVDRLATSAVDYWTPNPATVGKVGQVLSGLGEIAAPLAAAGGNPALMIANQQIGTTVDLVRQGVDANAAMNTGALQGLAAVAGFKTGGFGSNVWERMGYGAAGNLAVNTTAAGLSEKYLKSLGYTEPAKAFDPNDPTARFADVIVGAAFGILPHGAKRPDTQTTDAALAQRAADSVATKNPGTPANIASDVASQRAVAEALNALNSGEIVNVAPVVADANWKLNPVAQAVKDSVTGGTPQMIADAAAKAGVNPDLALAISTIESNNRPDIKNPKSSAQGLFQVTDATWKQFGGTAENRNDPQAQAEIGARIIADYSAKLENKLGRPIEAHEAYMAHLLGPKGADVVLTADPNARLIDVVKSYDAKNAADIVNNNGMKGMTVAEAIDKWRGKVASIAVGDRPEWTKAHDEALNTKLREASDLVKRSEADPENLPLMRAADEAHNAAEDLMQLREKITNPEPVETASPAPDVAPEPAAPAPEPVYREFASKDGGTLVFDSLAKATAMQEAAGKGYQPFDTGDGWILRKEMAPRTEAQKRADAKRERDANTPYPDSDSLWTAIAKMGGLNKAEAVSTWGADPKQFRPSKVFRKPTLTHNGLSIDEMGQRLADLGYLPRDEHGRYDVHDFEDAFANGDKHMAAQGYEAQAEARQRSIEEEWAAKALDSYPDMTITLDDGRKVSARDFYEQAQAETREAANDARAFDAAISCALGA